MNTVTDTVIGTLSLPLLALAFLPALALQQREQRVSAMLLAIALDVGFVLSWRAFNLPDAGSVIYIVPFLGCAILLLAMVVYGLAALWLRLSRASDLGQARPSDVRAMPGQPLRPAGFCTECSRYVWLESDQSCENGHPRSAIRGVYFTTAAPANPTTEAGPAAPVASAPGSGGSGGGRSAVGTIAGVCLIAGLLAIIGGCQLAAIPPPEAVQGGLSDGAWEAMQRLVFPFWGVGLVLLTSGAVTIAVHQARRQSG